MSAAAPTAGLLVIGDEILSGRTKDRNIGAVADVLTALGIDLEEVRIVPDRKDAIVEAVRALFDRYTLVFTTGGIGPTHDDITAEAIAETFGVPLDLDERAVALLSEHYARTGRELTEARLRMARIPRGADLIENPVSAAPGFILGNVHVMAGVPAILEAMLETLAPRLPASTAIASETVEVQRPESEIAAALTAVQEAHPAVRIGSYPREEHGRFSTQVVLRSRDRDALQAARAALDRALETA